MSTKPELIGKIVRTPHRLILGRTILPGGWRGEILTARDNGLGQILLTVCWQETGGVDNVKLDEVEVLG